MDAREKDRIASIVHRDCSLISGSTFYNAAHLAIEAMEARSKRMNDAASDLLEIASETSLAAAAYLEDHPHVAPHDCYATGPKTGNDYHDLVRCPGCQADASFRALIAKIDALIAKATGSQS